MFYNNIIIVYMKYVHLVYIAIIILLFIVVCTFVYKQTEHFAKSGVLIFCQGCTDIMNHLGLIQYYSEKYDKLYVCSVTLHKNLLTFYTKNTKIEIVMCGNDGGTKMLEYISNEYNILEHSDYLFHGVHDVNRKDNDIYKNKFSEKVNLNQSDFVNLFYSTYDIPVSVRIDYFRFIRDYKLENETYDAFVQQNGDKYILYHSNDNDNFIPTKKEFKYINLNQKTDTFFDYIKILENAIELHLMDSCWACFVYLLDTKYRLFKNKVISLYPQRNYIKMFQDPIRLDNWLFIQ